MVVIFLCLYVFYVVSTTVRTRYYKNVPACASTLAKNGRINRTIGRTYCPIIIMHIPQKKRGVAANLLYPYVGLTYINVVVAINGHRSDFKINMLMF